MTADIDQLSARLVARLTRLHQTVATAESLTGGLVVAALTEVPGSSQVVRGGIVAYASDVKTSSAGVDPGLLAAHGPVHPDVAVAMARGARSRLGATYGVATTGVAGPDLQDGHPVGEVHVAVAGPASDVVRSLPADPAATRQQVRSRAVVAALGLLDDVTREASG